MRKSLIQLLRKKDRGHVPYRVYTNIVRIHVLGCKIDVEPDRAQQHVPVLQALFLCHQSYLSEDHSKFLQKQVFKRVQNRFNCPRIAPRFRYGLVSHIELDLPLDDI